MKKGWVALHRSLLDNPMWEEVRKFSKAEAWIDLILMANHSEKQVWIKNTLFTCGRGEQLRSLETLRKKWGWSKSAVNRFLKTLSLENKITTKNETQTTRIYLCNYKDYQDSRNANESAVKRKRNASETELGTNNNDKNKNNGNNVKQIPTLEEFCQYLIPKLSTINPEWTKGRASAAVSLRYETYIADGWKDGHGKAIKNWKTKAVNAIKHEKPWSYGSEEPDQINLIPKTGRDQVAQLRKDGFAWTNGVWMDKSGNRKPGADPNNQFQLSQKVS